MGALNGGGELRPAKEAGLHIRYGYLIEIETAAAAEIAVRLDVHPDQRGDITQPDAMAAEALAGGGAVDASRIDKDRHGNLVRRVAAPEGGLRLRGVGVLFHSGFPDPAPPEGRAIPPADLPADVLPFLLSSRCCPTAELTDQPWSLFRHVPEGWSRVQAVCEYLHRKLRAAEANLHPPRTASEVLAAGAGSITDFAHAAIAFCRSLDIPARYCAGYLAGSGNAVDRCEGGFCAWFEAYLDGGWWAFDAWHTEAPLGRILVARGLDAADAPTLAAPTGCRIGRLDLLAEVVEGARYPATAQDRREHWQAMGARTGS